MTANNFAPDTTLATEQLNSEGTDTPLSELVSDEAGQTGGWDLQVFRSEFQEYSYIWKGTSVTSKKLVVILKSSRPQQYCLGIARMQKKDEDELKNEGQVSGRYSLEIH